MSPERVGPYLVEEKLGAGGMGTVYLGVHAETGRRAAVKVLPASLAREEGFLARFEREIAALQQVENPHIVELYDSGDDDGTSYYAMEYVQGETLTERLRRERKIPWRDAVEIAIQVCTALKAAHDAGIVHRDLKPSNLILRPDGVVKLADFGVAHVFAGTKLTATGGVIGTAEYMSPEQAKGRRVTKQSDLYSLGIVLYTMLTGRPPFSGATAADVLQKHLYGRFDRPQSYAPAVPFWLDELVVELLEKDPEKRPPDAYVLSKRLREIVTKSERAALQDETLAAGTSRPTVSEGEILGDGLGATFVRDLVRAEVEREQHKSAFGRLLDNTWVLVTLFVVVVGGGTWLVVNSSPTPEQRFATGVDLMEGKEGPGWFRARDEFFEPLLDEDADTWEPRVKPYLDKIDRYEFRRRFDRGIGLRRTAEPKNDAERFLLMAHVQRESGDLVGAERTLSALRTLLTATDEHADLLQIVDSLLIEVRGTKTQMRVRGLLRSAVDGVERARAAGDSESALATARSVLQLYGNDESLRDLLTPLRELVAEAEAEASPAAGTDVVDDASPSSPSPNDGTPDTKTELESVTETETEDS